MNVAHFKLKSHFEFVDFCKGLAMLMIIVVHSGQSFPNMSRFIFYGTIYGQMGCQLFLMMSAFLLCVSFEKGKLNSIEYYISKYFKLIIPFVLAMIVYMVICQFGSNRFVAHIYNPKYSLKNFILNLLLLQQVNIDGYNSLVPGGWYLGALWLIYLLFPFICKVYNKLSNKSVILVYVLPVVVLLIVIFLQTILISNGIYRVGNNTFLYFSLINQFPAVWMGIKLYFDVVSGRVEYKDKSRLLIMFIILTCISLIVLKIDKYYSFPMAVFFSSCSFYSLSKYIYIIIKGNKIPILVNKIISNYGKNSLGIYLTHFIYAWFVPQCFLSKICINQTALFLMYLLLTFILSYLTGIVFNAINNCVTGVWLRTIKRHGN